MIVTEDPKFKKLILDAVSDYPSSRKGWHVTALIPSSCDRKPYFRKLGIEGVRTEQTEVVFIAGKGHHHILEVFKPNEVKLKEDGISGTIDMVKGVPVEIKTTRGGTKRGILQHWIEQLMAYCYMSRKTSGRLLVLHLMGDWKASDFLPILKSYKIKFTKKELKTNWKKMKQKRTRLRRCLKGDEIPPKPKEKWQCDRCDYTGLCKEIEVRGIRPILDKLHEMD